MDDARYWLVAGGYWWGRGATKDEALREARRHTGEEKGFEKTERHAVWRVHPETYVNGMGQMVSPDDAADPEKVSSHRPA
mgnify:CR=1 FL=1